jgi:hypothetical protein
LAGPDPDPLITGVTVVDPDTRESADPALKAKIAKKDRS